MHIICVDIQNFRKLKQCRIDLSKKETVLVGPNNSGKTSAMDAMITFLKRRDFSTRDFTLNNWIEINKIGSDWLGEKEISNLDLSISKWEASLPSLDLWFQVTNNQIHLVKSLIPTLDWEGGILGVRLRFEPNDIEKLYKEFSQTFNNARKISAGIDEFKMWPEDMWSFLDKKSNLKKFFSIKSYLLDPAKQGIFQTLLPNTIPLENDILTGLIKVDIINAQRGFSDEKTDSETTNIKNLSNQLRGYYDKHLNPSENPTVDDVNALKAIQSAKLLFDKNLKESFNSALGELEGLNYPGFGNPKIHLSSKVDAVESLNHDSSVQYSLDDANPKLTLPEKYNGLGYQNLISMIFKLIRFRDEWMQIGKRFQDVSNEEVEFEPIHLVLIEEPEAHLHAQVQQVFIREAYNVLRKNQELGTCDKFTTQMVVSTHSSHIAHEIDFKALRYFKRNLSAIGTVNTSKVVNLSTTFGSENETTKFAIRYLKTTHSDLFFADAVILVEGPVERMLTPHFIVNHFEKLHSCYLSILEIGGSHAHTLLPLIQKLGIITLIVTDLDSVNPASNNSKVRPVLGNKYITGNDTIKTLLKPKTLIDDLTKLTSKQKELTDFPIKIAFQTSLQIGTPTVAVTPYTFEDSLVMENKNLFAALTKSTGLLQKMIEASKETDITKAAEKMYDVITGRGVKKAEFALELLYFQDPKSLKVPHYISEGLVWLQEKLKTQKDGIVSSKS